MEKKQYAEIPLRRDEIIADRVIGHCERSEAIVS